MRTLKLLCLGFILAACAAPPQSIVPVETTSQETAIPATSEPTAKPTTVTKKPETPPEEKKKEAAKTAPVPLSIWDGGQDREEIRLVDPYTGQDAPGFEPILASPYAFSSDGKRLAAIETQGTSCDSYAGGSACRGNAKMLHVVDLTAGSSVSTEFPGYGWVWPATFSPQGELLALVFHGKEVVEPVIERKTRLMLFDAGTSQLLEQVELDFNAELLAFSPQGDALVAYGQPWGEKPGMSEPGAPRALRVSVPGLEIEWEHTFEGLTSGDWCLENCEASYEEVVFAYWKPAVLLSHDRAALYIVHADADRLTSVDLSDGAVETVEIREKQSWLERLLALTAGVAHAKGAQNGTVKEAVLSLDGTKLYVVGRSVTSSRDEQGNWQLDEQFLGVQVVEVESGRLLERRELAATEIDITPDGKHLLLKNWTSRGPATEVLDAESLEPVAHLEGWEVTVSRGIDGEPRLLAYRSGEANTALGIVDPESLEIAGVWTAPGYATWISVP